MGDVRQCIICNDPVGDDGFLCNIKDIVVSFCGKHSDECKMNCENCVHTSICPAAQKS